MDQPAAVQAASSEGEIDAILDRARTLTGDELVALARCYAESADPRTTVDGFDRRRVMTVAKARAVDRADEIRDLEARAAEALRDIGPSDARRALRRLGVLEQAEHAITDAVLAVALRDRLGAAVATELARPFETVR